MSAWTRFDTDPDPDFIGVGLKMSNNGGANWTTLSTPARRIDPSTSNPAIPYSRITDASVAFARDGSFYLLTVQHNDANSAGEVVLARYSSGGSLANETTVYAWNRSATNQGGAKAVQLPILAVDNTAPTFPTASGTQTNSHAGNVYVAWIGQTPAPSGATNWNELTVELTTSTDSGATFGNALVLNSGGNFGDQRNTTPRIAVSQGGGGSQPGQVTVVWDDFNTGATANPPVQHHQGSAGLQRRHDAGRADERGDRRSGSGQRDRRRHDRRPDPPGHRPFPLDRRGQYARRILSLSGPDLRHLCRPRREQRQSRRQHGHLPEILG